MKRILFVTNDFFDAKHSRSRFKKWIDLNLSNAVLEIAAPQKKDNDNYCPDVVLKSRGISISNILKITSILKEYDVIIYRGLENIILSLFISNRKIKHIYFLTGLGRLFSDKIICKKMIRILYRYHLNFLMKLKKSTLIVQNVEDKDELNLTPCHIVEGSGFPFVNKIKRNHKGKIRILTSSRLTKAKGLDEIIIFCEFLINKNLDFEYFILGDYSSLSQRYQEKISHLNTHSQIEFTGFVESTDRYFEKCDFSYLPTRYREGSPRFLIQSLAYSHIIFTNDMPGCKKIVSNNNGFLNLSGETIIDKILNLTIQEKVKLSENSYELFLSTYCDKIVFKKFLELILK